MWDQLKKEWQEDPDPIWLKVLAVVVVPLFFVVMVML
jgi:hypothetical protein